ncbi:hypothetical protein DFJ74DRAFT_165030 [Hyaloraphidium curvatum]|nr:hypothetical protein DFJ74DRAFT_165030 [Hyaloraphidium curvatum]
MKMRRQSLGCGAGTIFLALLAGFSLYRVNIGHDIGRSCDWAVDPESEECKNSSRSALRELGEKVLQGGSKTCALASFGQGFGHHKLCTIKSFRDCIFYSFGISYDYSFDSALGDKGCRGFGLDPTVVHRSTLHRNVMFIQMGAKMLTTDEQTARWHITSVPGLRQFLGHTNVTVLKMDCEGCEYSLARDVAMEDPHFFQRVGQFALEIHTGKAWARSDRHVHYLGLLFAQLQAANLELQHAVIVRCGPSREAEGCIKKLNDSGYPCQPMCHNLLFARPDLW